MTDTGLPLTISFFVFLALITVGYLVAQFKIVRMQERLAEAHRIRATERQEARRTLSEAPRSSVADHLGRRPSMFERSVHLTKSVAHLVLKNHGLVRTEDQAGFVAASQSSRNLAVRAEIV